MLGIHGQIGCKFKHFTFIKCNKLLISIYSRTADILVGFHGKHYFDVTFHCYSDNFEEEKLYQVHCNITNGELRLKIPQEGTKKCVQVSHTFLQLYVCKGINFV